MFPESPDQLRHARLVALFSMFIVVLVIPLSLVQAFFGSPKVMAIILTGVIAVGLVPLLRVTRSVVLTANVLVGLFAAALTAVTVIRGGFGVPIVTAFVVIPMLAVTLAGWDSGKVWLVITLVILCVVGVVQRYIGLPPAAQLADPVATNWPGTLVFVAATYVLMAVTVHLQKRAMQDHQAAEEQLWESERLRTASENEAQLLRSSRMAELGTLAAGVAHEINNPLSYIHNNVEYLHRIGTKISLEETEQIFDEIRTGADRIARIVRDIGTFSRVDTEEAAEPLDVREALDSAVNLLQNQLRHRATLHRDYREVPLVLGSPSRLGQVFVNVLTNALQALPEGRVEESQIAIRVRSGSGAEPSVTVEIEDNGGGVPPEVKSRAFEPFYTTKPVGVGTGLGLSICYGIVNKLGGQIRLDSVVGQGTTVTIELPASTVELRDPTPASPATAEGELSSIKILIVDDDRILAQTIARMLGHHDVTVVTSGSAALTQLERGASFDVLLCDLMMPELTGIDLYERLERSHRELARRVIFITGGAFTAQARDFLQRTSNVCLEKPLNFEQLEQAIRGLVN
jgi:signal transduction histidine kinase/CheY-like chemotaxis protein